MSCIFCNILRSNDKSKWIYETDECCCFPDIDPKAPVHLLVIPKLHIESLSDVSSDNVDFIRDIFSSIPKIVSKVGLESYRLVSNNGKDAGQRVMHVHFHILGGRSLGWPPG